MTIIITSADKSTAILFPNNILSLLYEEGEVSLGEGNCVLFYSDVLVEADDPQGQMFGIPRLRALISEHGEERLLGNFLMEELYYFVEQGWEQEDDIILLTLRRSVSPS